MTLQDYFIDYFKIVNGTLHYRKVAQYVWGFAHWPTRACLPIGMDTGSRAAKSRSWVKDLFLDQISKKPCQPELLRSYILSMRIYSDGHCAKLNDSGSYYL
jgi:hypothetical protein